MLLLQITDDCIAKGGKYLEILSTTVHMKGKAGPVLPKLLGLLLAVSREVLPSTAGDWALYWAMHFAIILSPALQHDL